MDGLDKIDLKILRHMQEDASHSAAEIADSVGSYDSSRESAQFARFPLTVIEPGCTIRWPLRTTQRTGRRPRTASHRCRASRFGIWSFDEHLLRYRQAGRLRSAGPENRATRDLVKTGLICARKTEWNEAELVLETELGRFWTDRTKEHRTENQKTSWHGGRIDLG